MFFFTRSFISSSDAAMPRDGRHFRRFRRRFSRAIIIERGRWQPATDFQIRTEYFE